MLCIVTRCLAWSFQATKILHFYTQYNIICLYLTTILILWRLSSSLLVGIGGCDWTRPHQWQHPTTTSLSICKISIQGQFTIGEDLSIMVLTWPMVVTYERAGRSGRLAWSIYTADYSPERNNKISIDLLDYMRIWRRFLGLGGAWYIIRDLGQESQARNAWHSYCKHLDGNVWQLFFRPFDLVVQSNGFATPCPITYSPHVP